MAKIYQQNVTIGTTSTDVLARDVRPRDVVILTNNSDEEMFLGIGMDAELNKGICLEVGQRLALRRTDRTMENEEINAICSSGSKNLAVYVVNARLANFNLSVNESLSINENLGDTVEKNVSVYEEVSIDEGTTVAVITP